MCSRSKPGAWGEMVASRARKGAGVGRECQGGGIPESVIEFGWLSGQGHGREHDWFLFSRIGCSAAQFLRPLPAGLHPFGNLAIPRAAPSDRWTHGFASPPYDGFAVSRTKRSKRLVSAERLGHDCCAGKSECKEFRDCSGRPLSADARVVAKASPAEQRRRPDAAAGR
jgi:hypothetical protein